MSRLALAAALTFLLAPGLARAQQPTVPLDAFLEQRVAEELAADGMILSRLGVTLDIEVVGERAIVSLVDPATRRILASAKIDALPADREAAVASTMQVVANLAAEVASAAPKMTGALKALLDSDREQRRKREAAEYRYRQEAISFGDELVASPGQYAGVRLRWVAYQGEIRKRLEGEAFYITIGRQDLARRYQRRRNGGLAAMIAGSAVMVGAATLFVMKSWVPFRNCQTEPNFAQCNREQDQAEREAADYRMVSFIGLGVGAIPVIVGAYYYSYRPHPISEGDAQELGRRYNIQLRRKYNLVTGVGRPPRMRDVTVTPYAGGDGGGLAIVGRF